ncbi:MAG: GatB/YqeY domain-containing protein [Ignavibacteriales bacterium]|nr:GatB/YqeY domain-containing protein [Ignavibacteriales bacterium]
MTFKEKISEDLKVAMKTGDKIRLETLRTIRAGLLEKEVEKRPIGGMNPEDEVAVLIAASKKRKEAIDIYRQNNRPELAEQEEKELSIIQEYLPQQAGVEEITAFIKKTIQEVGAVSAKDLGKVMPIVVKEFKGRADGKIIQEIVKNNLPE